MLSTGEQAGFGATITRPDGTRSNEYDVKHRMDKNGSGVTECWLECENDAVFQIRIDRKNLIRFGDSQWRASSHVDGRQLSGSAWCTVEEPFIVKYIYCRSPGRAGVKKGLLTFSVAETTFTEDLVTIQPGAISGLGTITIRLKPGKWVAGKMGSPTCTDPLGLILESKNKLASVTKSTNEVHYNEQLQCYNLEPDHPYTWQTFIFKYRHRAALEVMGVIEGPEITPPPKPIIGKRSRESSIATTEENKPNIRPVAGPSTLPSAAKSLKDESDSDEDERAWKAAKARRIKKLKAEIDSLERSGRDGSKSKSEDKAKMKAQDNTPINLCSDSD